MPEGYFKFFLVIQRDLTDPTKVPVFPRIRFGNRYLIHRKYIDGYIGLPLADMPLTAVSEAVLRYYFLQ